MLPVCGENVVAVSWTRVAVSAALVTGVLVAVPLATSVPAAATTQSADAVSAPDEATALKLASEFGHAVTVDSSTTETELVQAQPNGTMHLSENSEPVRVLQGDTWVPVDSSLAAVDGALQPQAAAVPVKFSAGGSGPLAQVQADSGQWLSETWAAGALPSPTVNGSTATYANVYPGVDLQLAATPTGMSDVLVIKNATAAANPALSNVTFGINDGSLTTTLSAGGTTLVKDDQGNTQLSATTATWWDSSSAGASATGPGGPGLAQPLAATTSGSSITVNAASALATPEVTYPVYVDPPWSGGRTAWGMVDSAYADTAYWKDGNVQDGYQHVGYIDAGSSDDGLSHTTQSYWQMGTDGLAGKHILDATFATTEVWAYSCTPSPVQLWTSQPLTSSSTWNSRPALVTLSDTQTVAYGYSSACGSQGQVHFDAAAAVQRTADASASTLNLALVAQNASDHSGWKKFLPAAALGVDYVSAPSVPSNRKIQPCFAVCGVGAILNSRTPTFTGNSGDVDGAINLNYFFSVCAGRASSVGACYSTLSSGSQQAGHTYVVNLPTSDSLTEGAWTWRMQACRVDYTSVCSGWTSYFDFQVDVTAPNPPSVSSSDLDLTNQTTKGSEHVPATVHFGTDSVNVWEYAYTSGTVGERLANAYCPRTANGVSIVCNTGTPTGLIVPEYMANTLVVYAYDAAGNRSAPKTVNFKVVVPTASASVDHVWLADHDDYQSSAPQLADANEVSNALPLSLSNIAWRSNGTDPADDPNTVDTSMPQHHDAAMYFNGTNAEADSATSASNPAATLDGTHSLTIAAWVKPDSSSADAGSMGVRVIASQDVPGGHSAFTLQRSSGHWQMCAPTSTGSATDCATTPDAYADDGNPDDLTWVLVIGTFDSNAKKLGVSAYNYDSLGFPAAAGSVPPSYDEETTMLHSSVAAASAGAVVLGRDQTTSGNRWHGEIAGIELYSGVDLDSSQRSGLWATPALPTTNGTN